MVWARVLLTAVWNVPFMHETFTWPHQLVLAVLVVYMAGAAWWDVRSRRIPNAWTAGGLSGVLVTQVALHSWIAALCGAGLVGILLFWPTVANKWGVGDWKMCMVLGAALGAVPTLVIVCIALLITPSLKQTVYRLSLRYLPSKEAQSIPVAVPVWLTTCGTIMISDIVVLFIKSGITI